MGFLRSLFGSSKLGMALVAVVFTVLNDVLQLPISEEAVESIMLTLWGWLGLQGGVDIAQSIKGSKTS